MSEILTFLSSITISGLLAAGLIFLAKNLISERLKNAIKNEYDAQLETHKAQLKREYDKEIEQLKAQLQITAAERHTRFSNTFEKMADTIAATYAKLQALHQAVEQFTQSMPGNHEDKKQHSENIRSKFKDFLDFYLPRKIFLPKKTNEKIINCSNALRSSMLKFAMFLTASEARIGQEHVENRWERFEEVQKEVSELLSQLEADFQSALGLSD